MGVLRKCARATPDFGPSGRQKPAACRHPPAASSQKPAAPILALLLLLLATCSPTPPPTPTAIPSPTPSPTFTPEPTPTPPRIEALVPLSGPAEHYPFGIEGAKPLPEDIGISLQAIPYQAGVVSVVEMGDEGPLVAVVTELKAGEGGSLQPTGRVALFLTAGRGPLELGEVELEKGAVVDYSADRTKLVVKNPDGTTQTLLSPLPTSGQNGVFFGCSGPKLAWVVEKDGKPYLLPAVDIAWEKPAELADKISEAQWNQIRGALIEAINTYLLEQAKKAGKSWEKVFARTVEQYGGKVEVVLSPVGETRVKQGDIKAAVRVEIPGMKGIGERIEYNWGMVFVVTNDGKVKRLGLSVKVNKPKGEGADKLKDKPDNKEIDWDALTMTFWFSPEDERLISCRGGVCEDLIKGKVVYDLVTGRVIDTEVVSRLPEPTPTPEPQFVIQCPKCPGGKFYLFPDEAGHFLERDKQSFQEFFSTFARFVPEELWPFIKGVRHTKGTGGGEFFGINDTALRRDHPLREAAISIGGTIVHEATHSKQAAEGRMPPTCGPERQPIEKEALENEIKFYRAILKDGQLSETEREWVNYLIYKAQYWIDHGYTGCDTKQNQ